TSCEKVANIDIPVPDPQLAVFAFIEDGQPLLIRLQEVVPIFSKTAQQPGAVSGASIRVSDGQQDFVFEEDASQRGTYTNTSFRGEAGKTYTLEVVKSGYPSLFATCSIPNYLPSSIK